MKAARDDDFDWELLLAHIKLKKVIPVIGPGLYRVEIDPGGKKECLLYDYLAEQLLNVCGIPLQPDKKARFAKACLEFLKNNKHSYLRLSTFLKQKLEGLRLPDPNPLWKLARIKAFNLFINTTYDNYLAGTIKTARRIPTKELYYTVDEKEAGKMSLEYSKCLDNSKCTVVYQVFGNINKNVASAFTEKDILESILELHKDMSSDPRGNKLSWKLKSSSLLFIGCGLDDWLFRFFIHILADAPKQSSRYKQFYKFVVDNFADNNILSNELWEFLKDYEVKVFDSSGNVDFVDMLFEKIKADLPSLVIQPSDFAGTVFISFEGKDRPAARSLAQNLRNDGIGVWLDEREFKGGEPVDETIIKAINNCRAFIPLISQHSQQIQTDDKKLKYHIQEWHQAYSNRVSRDDLEIIPVKIDDTKWMYDKFKNLFYFKIPGGDRAGDYEKLKNQLRSIQRNIQG